MCRLQQRNNLALTMLSGNEPADLTVTGIIAADLFADLEASASCLA